jgi:hypothetical protein
MSIHSCYNVKLKDFTLLHIYCNTKILKISIFEKCLLDVVKLTISATVNT